MRNTWIVFFLMLLAYVWIWKTMKLSSDKSITIRAEAPTFRQNCTTKDIPCIDDCSFLCVENDAKCIGGICQIQDQLIPVPCKEETGGILMIVNDPAPHWACVCTNSTFFRGPDCSELNEDVCEQGMFLYKNRKNFLCLCLPPYHLITIDNKPHCVEKAKLNFFTENIDVKNFVI